MTDDRFFSESQQLTQGLHDLHHNRTLDPEKVMELSNDLAEQALDLVSLADAAGLAFDAGRLFEQLADAIEAAAANLSAEQSAEILAAAAFWRQMAKTRRRSAAQTGAAEAGAATTQKSIRASIDNPVKPGGRHRRAEPGDDDMIITSTLVRDRIVGRGRSSSKPLRPDRRSFPADSMTRKR